MQHKNLLTLGFAFGRVRNAPAVGRPHRPVALGEKTMIAAIDTNDPDRLFLLVVLPVDQGAGVNDLSAVRRDFWGFRRLQLQVSPNREQLRAIGVRRSGGQAPGIGNQGDSVKYRKANNSKHSVLPFLDAVPLTGACLYA